MTIARWFLCVLSVTAACAPPPKTLFQAGSPKSWAAAKGYGVRITGREGAPKCGAFDLDARRVARMMGRLESRFLVEPKTETGEEVLIGLVVDTIANHYGLGAPGLEAVAFKGKTYGGGKRIPVYTKEEIRILAPRVAEALARHTAVTIETDDFTNDADKPRSLFGGAAPSEDVTRVTVSCDPGTTILGTQGRASVDWSFSEIGGLAFRDTSGGSIGYYTFDGQRYDHMLALPNAGSPWAGFGSASFSADQL